jgi:hypothetical protein
MPRKRRTARTRIAGVVSWAQRLGYYNIAAELNDVLALLPPDSEPQPATRRPRKQAMP